MINLLPQEKKSELKKEYRLRLVAVSLFAGSAVILFAVAAFLPLYLSFSAQSELLDISTIGDIVTPDEKLETRAIVKQTRRQLSVLEEEEQSPVVTELIPEVIKRKGPTDLQRISYQRTGDDIIIRANGVAPERGDLISFIRALEESRLFSQVQSPVSNLVREENVVFSLELVVKNP